MWFEEYRGVWLGGCGPKSVGGCGLKGLRGMC